MKKLKVILTILFSKYYIVVNRDHLFMEGTSKFFKEALKSVQECVDIVDKIDKATSETDKQQTP